MISLSIIIPVFNVEKYIYTCLESIYNQGLDESCFEVIIVNDGTKDNSINVIRDIISQHYNIIILNQENQGSWVARNTGMKKASGEYILFIDPDDLLFEKSLKTLLEKALETKADIYLADYMEMNDEDIDKARSAPPKQESFSVTKKTGEQLFLEDLDPHHCYIWRSLFKKEFLLKNHLTFNPEFYYQDVPFLHECYIKATDCYRVSWLLTIYRRGHESATYSFNSMKARSFSIAIANTWELSKRMKLNKGIKNKLNEDIYISFSHMTRSICYCIKEWHERIKIIDFLKEKAPDLGFGNGAKQKIVTLLYHNMPHSYIILLYMYVMIIEGRLRPLYRHHIRKSINKR